MELKAFKRWYMLRVNSIISDSPDSDRSAQILQKLNDLKVFENMERMQSAKKDHSKQFILEIVKIVLSFAFNILLCGMVFSYERFAPIITKCFGWVRPMPI